MSNEKLTLVGILLDSANNSHIRAAYCAGNGGDDGARIIDLSAN
ncbi:hypothetical protein [Acidocella sp.]|nr:hypothetical protein [Acidocella sp.]